MRRLLFAPFALTLLATLLMVAITPAQQTTPPKQDSKDQPKKPDPKEEEAKKKEEAKKLAAQVAEQKKAAEENWANMEVGDPTFHETPELLLVAPKKYANKIDKTGTLLGRYYATAKRALQMKEKPWPGKLTVYLFAEREQFVAFRRRIEKLRVEPEDTCSFGIEGNKPYVSASPPRSVGDLPMEEQAGEQIASALLAKRIGDTQVSPWLIPGFGRATHYRVAPTAQATLAERQVAAKAVKDRGRSAQGVYSFMNAGDSGMQPDEAAILRANLADFMAYGPLAPKFVEFVDAFKPDREKKEQMRNTDQALRSMSIKPDDLNSAWQKWAKGG